MTYGIKAWSTYSNNIFPSPTNIYAWLGTASTNNCTISADTSTVGAVSGSIPLKMSITGGDPHVSCYNAKQWTLDIAEIGDTFTLSCYIKGSQAGMGQCQLFIFGVDDNGGAFTDQDFSAGYVSITTSWTRLSFTYTMTKAATKGVQIRLDGPDSGPAGASVWFDGLQLERNSSATAFTSTPANAVLVNNMLGGRVFIELLQLAPEAGNPGNIAVNNSGSITYTNIPGGQYLKYYTLQAGPYSLTTSTNGLGQAVLTFTRLYSSNTLRGSNLTTLAIFATRTTDPSHGLLVTNGSGDRLVSSNYVVPVFRGKVIFDAAPTYTSGLSRIHEKTISYGDASSHKLILYTIPQSTNVWFTGDSFISSGFSTYTLSTTYILPSSGTTYSLAEAYVFQLNNISQSSDSYGLRVWDSSSPQKITFDSGLQHVNIAGIQESPLISYNDNEQSITNSSLYGPYSAIVIPQFYQEIVTSTPPSIGSVIDSYRGVFRRQNSTIYYKIVKTGTGFEDAAYNYTINNGSQYDNTIFVVNTQLLGGSSSGGSGSTNSLTATISAGAGTETCTYSSTYSTSCTTTKTYNVTTSGGDGTTITYNWTITENSGNFTLTTASNLTYATLSQSGSSGTYACVLRCTVTQSGIQQVVDYPVQHTHSTATETYSITPSVTSINEGQSVTFTVATTNVPNGTVLYWTLNNVAGVDFTPSQNQGTVTIGTSITFTLTAFADQTTEGSEAFTISLRTGSYTGTVVATSAQVTIADTSTASTGWGLRLKNSSGTTITSLNGGTSQTLEFTYSTPDGVASLPTYSFTSSSANLTIANATGTMSGEIDTENGSPTYGRYFNINKDVTVTAANITSGNETVTINAYSPNGTTLRQTINITINDVAAPTVTLTPASSSINTSATTTVTVTTSKSTTNLVSGDISVSAGSISNFSGSGSSYSFTYTAPATAATVTISIAAGAFTDSNGNNNSAGSTTITVLASYANPAVSNVTVSPATIDENSNSSVTFTFDLTDNTSSGAPRTIYTSVEGSANVTTADFVGSLAHSHTSVNGTVSRTKSITIAADTTTEGSETFRINFYSSAAWNTEPKGAPYLQTGLYTINDTSVTSVPTYSVTPSATTVNEGSAVTFNVTTTNVANNTTLYWTNAGTTVAGDFQENVNSGSFTITNNAGSVTLTLSADSTTEGGETIDFKVRTGSTSGTIVATATTVNVSDTSTTPVALQLTSIGLSPNPVKAFQSYSITVNQNITSASANNLTFTIDQRTPNVFNYTWTNGGLISIAAGQTSGSYSGTIAGGTMRHNALFTATSALGQLNTVSSWGIIGGANSNGVTLIAFDVGATNSATENTNNTVIFLRAGQVIQFGTCNAGNLTGTSITSTSTDTYLRIVKIGAGTTVAQNDDYPGYGSASYISWQVTEDGDYMLRIGGFLNTAVAGTAAYYFA
jgi:hypothetical protein